jgi:hypothetical protein
MCKSGASCSMTVQPEAPGGSCRYSEIKQDVQQDGGYVARVRLLTLCTNVYYYRRVLLQWPPSLVVCCRTGCGNHVTTCTHLHESRPAWPRNMLRAWITQSGGQLHPWLLRAVPHQVLIADPAGWGFASGPHSWVLLIALCVRRNYPPPPTHTGPRLSPQKAALP